ncbi:hypothetical protein [Halomontanus rarus]|uniref:hypothetical protein n=1 Tax=Halomontanus rarus TaxID=3034020 RepID=UPI001A998DB6
MQSVAIPRGVELDDLPGIFWLFILGVAILLFGFALEWMGYAVEAGIAGALSLFFLGVTVLGQLLIWGLGKLD